MEDGCVVGVDGGVDDGGVDDDAVIECVQLILSVGAECIFSRSSQ